MSTVDAPPPMPRAGGGGEGGPAEAVRGPVFVAGGDRSGIGLVGEMLEMHPAFSITRRTDFFTYYAGRFGDLSDRDNLARTIEALRRDRRYKTFEMDVETLDRSMGSQKTYSRLFEALQEDRMRRLGRRRWGDKSLWSERHADTILSAYPTAKMIHVVRDPRDQFASYKIHRRRGHVHAAVGAAMWRQSMRAAERNLKRHHGRYAVLRYEDLVAEPERRLRDLCGFLDEPFAPEMLLEPSAEPGSMPPRVLHTESVGRFARDLAVEEVALIQITNRDRMERFGYTVDRLEAGWFRQRVFLMTRLPVGVAMMLIWDVRSAMRRGRAVPESRLGPC